MEEGRDFEKDWEEFWKDIVLDENGNINFDQLKKELSDYCILLENVPIVYSDLTHGEISYPNTESWEVISVAQDANNSYYYNLYKDDILGIIDEDSLSDEDKIEEIRDYFKEERD